MKKLIFCIGVLFILSGCNENCDDTACFTPPPPFNFEFIDADTGENLFTSGTLEEDDISVTNQADNSERFISEDDYNVLNIGDIGWETESVNYLIEVGERISFSLLVDAERRNEDCCSFTRINSTEIQDSEFEHAENSDLIRILVEVPNEELL
ncbi:membrane lipoprotein lipid attachment site-containing protein [Salegentibacter sp. F188]|uniref:Membrane lipoprotein lipid attachment site-containing protein n=1 Tax=Autumnicola patrickiae TaxID=3075591 RepID=A0ABU3DZR3_9FLAO|nr:membrane lipoprotein lipid attachment site-containing protein [Salegentibacter sp. F188]MDT0689192.1 membrane lipoprotein lipid attachment site-containing protein [Salegentibacter sp. F188]